MDLDHPDVSLDEVVIERNLEVVREAQHVVAVLVEPAQQVGCRCPADRAAPTGPFGWWRVLAVPERDDPSPRTAIPGQRSRRQTR